MAAVYLGYTPDYKNVRGRLGEWLEQTAKSLLKKSDTDWESLVCGWRIDSTSVEFRNQDVGEDGPILESPVRFVSPEPILRYLPQTLELEMTPDFLDDNNREIGHVPVIYGFKSDVIAWRIAAARKLLESVEKL